MVTHPPKDSHPSKSTRSLTLAQSSLSFHTDMTTGNNIAYYCSCSASRNFLAETSCQIAYQNWIKIGIGLCLHFWGCLHVLGNLYLRVVLPSSASTQLQLQLRLRLALFPSDPATQPPTRDCRFYTTVHAQNDSEYLVSLNIHIFRFQWLQMLTLKALKTAIFSCLFLSLRFRS